ncbi:MAG: DUF975 family protein [Clostridia bacterium]|nr:DUF975 family protein [Clostridia bacterium]MBQ9773200.1 DUF975 family protein [Clostridia bacterium]
MNQDQFQENVQFFDVPPRKNAKYYRTQARMKLSGVWKVAILVTLLAMLLGGIGGGGVSFEFSYTTDGSEELTEAEQAQFEAELQDVLTAIRDFDMKSLANQISTDEISGTLVLTLFFAFFIITILGSMALWLFVSAPVKVGYQRFFLETIDGNKPQIRVGTLFRFFKAGYFKSIRLELLHSLILFAVSLPMLLSLFVGLWMMLNNIVQIGVASLTFALLVQAMILPMTVIALGMLITLVLNFPVSYMYGFAHLILADYPTVGIVEALRTSRTLMRGNKWKLFCLDLSFIGWELLAALFTCGIGMIVVTPYRQTARVLFYHDVANRAVAQETEFPSIDPNDYTDTAF